MIMPTMAALVILAVIVVLLARLFQRKQDIRRDAENQQWYQQRLRELEDDNDNGRLSAEEYQQAKVELDKTHVTEASQHRRRRALVTGQAPVTDVAVGGHFSGFLCRVW